MVLDFQSPLSLLAFIPIGGLMVFIYLKYKERKLYKGVRPLVTRLIILLLVLLALAGAQLNTLVKDTELIFVADLSDSMEGKREELIDFISQAMDILPDNYKTGVIGFARDAQVEQALSDSRSFYDFHVGIKASYTNIEAALQRAEALFSPNSRKRIIVLTDGNENTGDGMMRAKALMQRGIRVDGVLFETQPTREVQLSDLVLPSSIYQGESYGVRVVIDSSIETNGSLKLFANRNLVGQQRVELQKGTNVFLFEELAEQSGTLIYEAEIETGEDTILQNNRMSTYIKIAGPPRVALVEGRQGEGQELAKILEAGGLSYKVFTPYSLPSDLDELVRYEAVLLANVEYDKLGDKKAEALKTYVWSLGKGLLTTGGDNSYIMGGYLGTVLEEVLPVDMEIKNREDTPNLALVLVIDKSGSMADGQYGLSKMDLAKEAAMRSLDVLTENDFIAVVAFDGAAYSVVDMQRADKKEKIQEAIGGMEASGGTNLEPGLKMALNSLLKTEAAVKHVIVLTDGHTSEGNFGQIVGDMTDNMITVSGVAIGEGADQRLMRQISDLGQGRFYYTNDFTSIPKIFTKETYHAKRNYINNETFYPVQRGQLPVFDTARGLPPLHGYTTTTIKAGAELVLASEEDDPILAFWNYGLGRAASWTSDAGGAWSEDWMTWSRAGDFWLNTISNILPGQTFGTEQLEIERDGSRAIISFKAEDNMASSMETQAVVVGPDNSETILQMDPVRPGLYQASFDLEDTGVYLVRVEQRQEEELAVMETGLSYPYSPEYDMRLKSSRLKLEHIVGQTDGRILAKPEDILAYEEAAVWNRRQVWPYLLLVALILFMYDVAARKLDIKRLFKDARVRLARLLRLVLAKTGPLVRKIFTKKPARIKRAKAREGLEDKAEDEVSRTEVSKEEGPKESSEESELDTKDRQARKRATEGEKKRDGRGKRPATDQTESDDFTGELLRARKKSKIK